MVCDGAPVAVAVDAIGYQTASGSVPNSWLNHASRVGCPWISSCCKDIYRAVNQINSSVAGNSPSVRQPATQANQPP